MKNMSLITKEIKDEVILQISAELFAKGKISEDQYIKDVKDILGVDIEKDHNDELNALLRQWRYLVPKIVSSESNYSCYDDYGMNDGPHLSEHGYLLFTIENDILFKDLIYHLMDNKLLNDWDNFKKKINEFDHYRFKLFKKIDADKNEFGTASIFVGALNLAKNMNLNDKYFYDNENKKLFIKPDPIIGHLYLIKDIDEDKIDEIKTNYEKISREYYNDYKNDINGIIEDEKYLIEMRKKFLIEMDKLINHPIPFKINCKYIIKSKRNLNRK